MVNVVTGGRAAGEALVIHPMVAKISFTGSDAAGRAIAARAGQRLIGCTLELGGKSPNIVFDDADIDQVEAGVLAGIFAAAGQTCVAGSRAFFQKGIYDRLVARLVDRAEKIRIGDPLKAETQMGPVATAAQLAKDENMVAQAVDEGARILAGGSAAPVEGLEGGYFYAPTILEGARNDAFIMQNEVFGPVLCVTPFETEEEVAGTGKRHAVRPRGRRVDPRHPPRASDGAEAAGRNGLDQHLSRFGVQLAVRRLQEQRHRSVERR